MPSPGSLVVMRGGLLAIVTKVTPLGDDDRVMLCSNGKEKVVSAYDIESIVYEDD